MKKNVNSENQENEFFSNAVTICLIDYEKNCVLLIPMILFDGLKDMAQKLLPTLFAQAAKLLLITLCMYFSMWVMLSLLFTESTNFNTIDFRNFYYVAVCLLLNNAACSNAPKIAQALMTGQPQLSMGEFIQTAGAAVAAGHMARTAAGKVISPLAGVGAKAAGHMVRNAPNIAGDHARAIGRGLADARNHLANGGGKLGAVGSFLGGAGREHLATAGRNLKNGMWRGGSGHGGAGGGGGSSLDSPAHGNGVDRNDYALNGTGIEAGMKADGKTDATDFFFNSPQFADKFSKAYVTEKVKDDDAPKGYVEVRRKMGFKEFMNQQMEIGRMNAGAGQKKDKKE